jgi:hypothetical protein
MPMEKVHRSRLSGATRVAVVCAHTEITNRILAVIGVRDRTFTFSRLSQPILGAVDLAGETMFGVAIPLFGKRLWIQRALDSVWAESIKEAARSDNSAGGEFSDTSAK